MTQENNVPSQDETKEGSPPKPLRLDAPSLSGLDGYIADGAGKCEALSATWPIGYYVYLDSAGNYAGMVAP